MVNIQDDFEQNQLFKETTLITDKKKEKKTVSSNNRSIILTSLIKIHLISAITTLIK